MTFYISLQIDVVMLLRVILYTFVIGINLALLRRGAGSKECLLVPSHIAFAR